MVELAGWIDTISHDPIVTNCHRRMVIFANISIVAESTQGQILANW
jgi:hypothetical protein